MITFGTRRHAVHPLTTNMDEPGTAATRSSGKQTKSGFSFPFSGILEKLRPRGKTAKDLQLAEDLYLASKDNPSIARDPMRLAEDRYLASTKGDPSIASGGTNPRIPYRKQSIQPSKPARRSQSLKVPVAPKRHSLSPEVEARYLALKGTPVPVAPNGKALTPELEARFQALKGAPVPVAPRGKALTPDLDARFQALKALGLPPGGQARSQGRNLKKAHSSR